MNVLTPKMPKDIHVFNGMALFYWCFIKNFAFHHGPHHKTLLQNRSVYMDCQMSRSVGGHKIEISGCTDFNYTQMGREVSHPHKCVKSSNQSDIGSESYLEMWIANYICLQSLEQCGEKLHHHQKRNTRHGLCFGKI